MADNQNSFTTGMALGLFAGAAGYFLLMTPEGRKMREKLEKEWKAARAAGAITLPEELPENLSLGELYGKFRQLIADAARTTDEPDPSPKRPRKVSARKSDARFKGV